MGLGMCIQNRGLRGFGSEGPMQDTALDWIPYPQGTEHWRARQHSIDFLYTQIVNGSPSVYLTSLTAQLTVIYIHQYKISHNKIKNKIHMKSSQLGSLEPENGYISA